MDDEDENGAKWMKLDEQRKEMDEQVMKMSILSSSLPFCLIF